MYLRDINKDKSLTQVLERLTSSIKTSLNCVKIGEIVSFDKTDQTVTVKVLHIEDNNYDLYLDKEIEYPLLQKVPVIVLQGGGSKITFPIKAGDQCLLLFCDYMIDGWWVSGESKPSIVPRKHDISDAIAIVGLQAITKAIQDYSDYLHLQYNANSDIVIGEQIDVNNENINLNGATKVSETLEVEKDVTAKANVDVTETLTAKQLNATTAASGSFVTVDNKTVTVENGIVTAIQ